jgi:Ferritin-like domain
VNYAPIRKFRLLANGPRVSPKPAAYILKPYFEEVGVTAYHGAAARIHDKQILTAAAGILGAEAYRASGVRLR